MSYTPTLPEIPDLRVADCKKLIMENFDAQFGKESRSYVGSFHGYKIIEDEKLDIYLLAQFSPPYTVSKPSFELNPNDAAKVKRLCLQIAKRGLGSPHLQTRNPYIDFMFASKQMIDQNLNIRDYARKEDFVRADMAPENFKRIRTNPLEGTPSAQRGGSTARPEGLGAQPGGSAAQLEDSTAQSNEHDDAT